MNIRIKNDFLLIEKSIGKASVGGIFRVNNTQY